MSIRLFALILVASQISGLAVANETKRYLLDEDRYLYAQPDAQATPAPKAPAFRAPPAADES